MVMNESTYGLVSRLGYEWHDMGNIVRALTHSSYGNIYRVPHNERYEFLGDSVLDLASADYLMAMYPEGREGLLSQKRERLVRSSTLSRHARRFGVGPALRVGNEALRSVDSVLADAFEAVVGALYIDCHSIDTARYWLVEWDVLVAEDA